MTEIDNVISLLERMEHDIALTQRWQDESLLHWNQALCGTV